MAAGVPAIRFGRRQQMLMEVKDDQLPMLSAALQTAALPFEVDADLYPNIMSSLCRRTGDLYGGVAGKKDFIRTYLIPLISCPG